VPEAVTPTATMCPSCIHFVFDIEAMVDFPRQENLSIPNAGKASDMAAPIDAYRDLLNMLFTVPEQLNGKRTLFDDPGPLVPQEFPGFGWLAGHQALSVLADDVHKEIGHSFKLSFQSEMLLADVEEGFYRRNTFSFRLPLISSHRA